MGSLVRWLWQMLSETEEVALTRIACRLLDDDTCWCAYYNNQHHFVPDCIVLKPENLDIHAYWVPLTCDYRLIWEVKPSLLSSTPDSVHAAGISVRGLTLYEFGIPEDDRDDHIIQEPL